MPLKQALHEGCQQGQIQSHGTNQLHTQLLLSKHSGLAAVQINSSETGKHCMTEGCQQGQDSKPWNKPHTLFAFCHLCSKHLGHVADHISSSETGIALRMSTWSRTGCQESWNKPPTPSAKQTDHINSSETGKLCIAEGCQQGQDAK